MARLKIGFDAQALLGKKTGVGYYTENMIRTMVKLDPQTDYSLVLFTFFTTKFAQPLKTAASNVHYRLIRVLPGRVFSKLLKWNLLPPLDLFLGKRFYIFPNYVRWPLLFSPSAVIIYDLSYIFLPEYSDEQNRRFLTKFVPRSIAKSQLVITISENSKKEIVEHYGVDPSKVIIAMPAIDPDFFKPATPALIESTRKKFKLPKQYILYVGTLEPRKNIVGLLASYTALPEAVKKDCPLVLAGGKGWKDDQIGKQLTAALEAKENIIQTGYFDEEDLPGLYSGATVFAYPSHYEGFGMPPLEAMACGTPVVTSNNSSLPEVVGDAAVTVTATDTAALTAALAKVIGDPKLAAKMRANGLKQAAKFRWEDGAQRIIDAVKATQPS